MHLQLTDDQGSFLVAATGGLPPTQEEAEACKQDLLQAAVTPATSNKIKTGMQPTQQDGSLALDQQMSQLHSSERQQSSASASTSGQVAGAQAATNLSLQPGKWCLFHAQVPPRCVGTLTAARLQLQLSPHASVAFDLCSFPVGLGQTLGGLSVSAAGGLPFKASSRVQPGLFSVIVQNVGPLPQLQVS